MLAFRRAIAIVANLLVVQLGLIGSASGCETSAPPGGSTSSSAMRPAPAMTPEQMREHGTAAESCHATGGARAESDAPCSTPLAASRCAAATMCAAVTATAEPPAALAAAPRCSLAAPRTAVAPAGPATTPEPPPPRA